MEKEISLWELADSISKRETKRMSEFYESKSKTVKEYSQKLNASDLTLDEADNIKQKAEILKANLKLLPSIINNWLNFHVQGNSERANKIREDYIDELKQLLKLSKARIAQLSKTCKVQTRHLKDLRKEKLQIADIALLFVYNKTEVTRENGNELISPYGWKSGDALYNHYVFYASHSNRVARPDKCTKKKLENKIARFLKVKELLSDDQKLQEQVSSEIEIMRIYLKNEDY